MSYHPNLSAPLRAILAVLAAAGAALALAACGKSAAQTGAPPPSEVDVAQVVVKPVRQWDEFSGRVAATDSVDVRARVSGYIDRIAFKEGDEVKSGDLLFVIDPRPYRAAYDSAVAQLERRGTSTLEHDVGSGDERCVRLRQDDERVSE